MLGFQLPFLNDLCFHPVLLGPVGWVPPNGVCTWVTDYNAVTSTQQVPSLVTVVLCKNTLCSPDPGHKVRAAEPLWPLGEASCQGWGVLKLLQSPSILNTAQGPSTKSKLRHQVTESWL